MGQNNELRKQAYRFYRSLGYTAKQATNLRNKSPKTLANSYRLERKKFDNKRFEFYRGERKKKPDFKPYRPKIRLPKKQANRYQVSFETEFGIPSDISDQMASEGDLLNLDNYEARIAGLKKHFTDRGMDWSELMAELEAHTLSDWFDLLGEYYDDDE